MSPEDRAARLRAFSNTYRRLEVATDAEIDDADMGGLQARVFMAIGQEPDGMSGPQLADVLRLHKSQMSRYLESFRRQGFIETTPAEWDARIQVHRLTKRGRGAHRALSDLAGEGLVKAMRRLTEGDQERLVEALDVARQVFDGPWPYRGFAQLRDARAGDFGWVIERHGTLYHEEQGYDETFEAFVAKGVAEFVMNRDVRKERAFIADAAGERQGCAFLVRESARVARLRFFLVVPTARGQHVGKRLLEAVLDFARHAGYDRIVLWTQSHLEAAIGLYEAAGFRLVKDEPHPGFGHPVRAQEWALELRPAPKSTPKARAK